MENLKRTVKVIDKTGNRYNVVIQITHKNNYPEFSITTDNGQDKFEPRTPEQKELLNIWDSYHLNGMNAGTQRQREVLKLCESTDYFDLDYTERCKFLSYHDIKGRPLTAFEVDRNKLEVEAIQSDIAVTKLRLIEIEDFYKEWKEANRDQWFKSNCLNVVKLLEADKDFEVKPPLTRYEAPKYYFFKSSQFLPTPLKVKVNNYVKTLKADLKNFEDALKSAQLETALFDTHKGKVYKYGTGWIKDELPPNLWEEVQRICSAIEEEQAIQEPDAEEIEELLKYCENPDLVRFIAESLEVSIEDAIEAFEDLDEYQADIEGTRYAIGTYEEVREVAAAYIKDSLWAFNASFLASQTDLPEEVFEALSKGYEDSNEAILNLIEKTCSLEDFIDAAIDADGLGHFINRYSGDITHENGRYYIIRMD